MTPRALAQILVLSAVWGISFLLIRIAGESFPPLWIALMRSALGAALLWTIIAVSGRKPPPRDRLLYLLLVALFNNAVPFTCFAWGEQVVPSNTASVLNATTPIWTLLLTMVIHRTRPRLAVIGGVLLGFAGVLLVVFSQSNVSQSGVGNPRFLGGVLLISIGTLSYAVAIVIAKAHLQGVDPLGVAAGQLTLAALMVSPLALTLERPSQIHPANWLAIALLGFAGSGFAYLLYFHLLTTISATHVVAVTYLLPLWGVFWGALAHESIGPATFLGIAVAITGLAWMNLRPARSPEPHLESATNGRDLTKAAPPRHLV